MTTLKTHSPNSTALRCYSILRRRRLKLGGARRGSLALRLQDHRAAVGGELLTARRALDLEHVLGRPLRRDHAVDLDGEEVAEVDGRQRVALGARRLRGERARGEAVLAGWARVLRGARRACVTSGFCAKMFSVNHLPKK